MKLFLAAGCTDFRQYITVNRGRFGFNYKKAERFLQATRLISSLPGDIPRPNNLLHFVCMSKLPAEMVADCWGEIIAKSGGVHHVTSDIACTIVQAKLGRKVDADDCSVALKIQPGSHNSNLWYTPVEDVLSRVEKVFGGQIDLDPCSDATAQQHVNAKQYYTVDDDGLKESNKWSGNVFINPPYSVASHNIGMQELFLDRALKEVKAENVTQCILLLKASTGSRWFDKVLTQTAYGLMKKRLTFSCNVEGSGKARFGNVVAYLGPNTSKFIAHFADVAFFPGHNCWSSRGVDKL
jgi:hypothetical protein